MVLGANTVVVVVMEFQTRLLCLLSLIDGLPTGSRVERWRNRWLHGRLGDYGRRTLVMITVEDIRPGAPLRARMNTGCLCKGAVLFVCEGTAGSYVRCSEGEHYLFAGNFCEFELADGPW